MRRYTLFLLIAIAPLTLNLTTVGQNSQASKADEDTIRDLEHQWITAFFKGDVATVDQLEAPDYTVADETGQETKAEQLKGIRDRKSPDMTASYTPEHQQFRFFGPTALVTGVYAVKGGEGNPNETTRLQITELWVNQGGKWKVEHVQYFPLQQQKP